MEMRISLTRSRERMETPIDVTANEIIGTVEANHVVEIVRVRISKYVKMGATKWQISCSTLVKPSKALVNELELKYLFFQRHALLKFENLMNTESESSVGQN